MPENPERPQGRQLRIAVAVLPATGRATKDPIVPLMGGPGEAAIVEAGALATMFAPLRRDRDLLLVDQRGTGRSNALRCTLYAADDPANSLRHVFPPDKVEQCARELSTRADLTQYGYLRFADDLERVRRALGYESLNLHAGSYGTRAAQVFVRAYPNSVRTAYLGSVVPIDLATPLLFAKSAEGAMNELLAECERDAACKKAFPNVREEFRRVIESLDSGQVRVAVPGSDEKAKLDRGRVAEWMRSQLYRPYSSTDLPG